MAVHVFGTAGFATGPDDTNVEFVPISGGLRRLGAGAAHGTEADCQIAVRASVTWQYARAFFVTITGATANINARVDGVDDTALTLSTSSTGAVEDTTGSVSLVDTDLINWEFGGGDGHGDQLQITSINTELDITNASDGIPLASGSVSPDAIGSGVTEFTALAGALTSWKSSEGNAEYTFRTAQDIANLRVHLTAHANGNSTVIARVNNADDTDLQVTLSGTGTTEDLTGVAEYAVADEGNWELAVGGTMNSDVATSISCTLETAQVRPFMSGQSGSPSANDFLPLDGDVGATPATEADAEIEFNTAATLQNALANIDGGGAGNLTLRVNRADDTSLQIDTAVGGIVEDLTGSVAIVADDEVNWQSSGTPGFTLIAVENDAAPPVVAPSMDSWFREFQVPVPLRIEVDIR